MSVGLFALGILAGMIVTLVMLGLVAAASRGDREEEAAAWRCLVRQHHAGDGPCLICQRVGTPDRREAG